MQEEYKKHISSRFDSELESLCNQFIAMGGLVEQQVSDAVVALIEGNLELADAVIEKDDIVNDYERKIDERVELMLAKRQPAAGDLRLTLMLSKATTDLERIGDEAAKIARVASQMDKQGHSPRGYSESRNLSAQVCSMIHEALDAFARFDLEHALKVVKTDQKIDEEYASTMRALLTYILEDNRYITQVINVMWVLRAIERVGDHARNVAEQVIYVICGEDVRHIDIDQIQRRVDSQSEAQKGR